MELLYLWIEDHKNIKKQGFNFSSKYRLEYDEENNQLTEIEYENHIKGFFGKNISNITAVIGENGSGKTSMIEFLVGFIQRESPYTSLGFIITNHGIIFYDEKYKGLQVNSKNNNYPLLINNQSETYEPSSILHYSPLLNTNNLYFFNDGALSGRGLGAQIYIPKTLESRIMGNETSDRSIAQLTPVESALLNYRTNESIQILEFLYNEEGRELVGFPINISDVMFSFNKHYKKFWQNIDANIKGGRDNAQPLQERFNEIEPLNPDLETELYMAFIYGILKSEYYHLQNFPKTNNIVVEDLINYLDSQKVNNNPKETLFKLIEYSTFTKMVQDGKNIDMSGDIKRAIVEIIDYLITSTEILDKHYTGFKIPFNEKKTIQTFLDLYKSFKDLLFENTEYFYLIFSISFVGLSSGEKDFIILYSCLLDGLKKEGKSLLLLDEPDVTFHPEWQKRFIKDLVTFIKNTSSANNNNEVQVIFTSHSPVSISDLPKENIIFLKRAKQDEIVNSRKYNEGNCIVVPGVDKEQTFGANIHTLLSDAFFMDNGLIGKFAKKKISRIIKLYILVDKFKDDDRLINYYKAKKKEFWHIQSIIGEEYIASKIKNHLEEIEKVLLGNSIAEINEIKRFIKKHGGKKEFDEKRKKIKDDKD